MSEDLERKKGRPLKLENQLKQQNNLKAALTRRVSTHDCNFAIKFINTEASRKMHLEQEEFRNSLGKRDFGKWTIFEETLNTLSELAKFVKLKTKFQGRSKKRRIRSKKHSKTTSTSNPITDQFRQSSNQGATEEDLFSVSEDSSYHPGEQSEGQSQISSLIDTENTPSYESVEIRDDFELDLFEPQNFETYNTISKKLKSQYFIDEEVFGNFQSYGKQYMEKASQGLNQYNKNSRYKECDDELFELVGYPSSSDNNLDSQVDKSGKLSVDPSYEIRKHERKQKKDRMDNNFCEMIDFGSDKPSVDQETSDDIDFIENSLISPSQSPRHKSSSKSIEELFLNEACIGMSPLNQALVGDKFTQVDI